MVPHISLSMPHPRPTSAPLNSLWLGMWAIFLSLGWLLPNHYLPWRNFQSDLWIAVMMGLAASVVIWKSRTVDWPWLSLGALALVGVPFLQYAFGLLPFAGQAWINGAYLLGFALALIVGSQWERLAPGQAADGLFLAIGAAAILSVGVQLYQWLVEGHGNTAWLIPSPSSRPFGNFAQPNQLATFLIWGLVACAWGVHKRVIGAPVALFMAAYLLFGIALAHSRTASATIVVVAIAAWLWRPLRGGGRYRRTALLVTLLAIYYLACLGNMDSINEYLLRDLVTVNMLEKTQNEVRRLAYSIFADAVLQSPWWGYGWSETARAQLVVAQDHPALGGYFFHAHNLFLDLLLWCGIPLGALLVGAIVTWFGTRAWRVSEPEGALLVVFIGAVGWHSMTELPLHYASFLLPTGLVMGILDGRRGAFARRSGRGILLSAFFAAALLLGFLARDYLEVEANFFALRFERAGLSEKPPLAPPETVMLTQLREYIRSMRTEVAGPQNAVQVQSARDLANSFPSEATLFNLIRALTLNNQPDQALIWIAKLAKVTAADRYAYLQRVWLYEANRQPELRAVVWPQWKE